MGKRVGTLRRTTPRGGRNRPAAADLVVCFGCGGISCFFSLFFFERTRPAAKHEAALPHFPLYKYICILPYLGIPLFLFVVRIRI